jgi:hypothetical protein
MTFGIVSHTRARNPWSVLQWFTNADRDKCTPVFCNLHILKYISKNSVHCMLIQQCCFYLQVIFFIMDIWKQLLTEKLCLYRFLKRARTCNSNIIYFKWNCMLQNKWSHDRFKWFWLILRVNTPTLTHCFQGSLWRKVSIIFNYGTSHRGRRDHDRMVVGFTTTCAISAYPH